MKSVADGVLVDELMWEIIRDESVATPVWLHFSLRDHTCNSQKVDRVVRLAPPHMSSHEAPAQVADFFSTIEEAGIADIAAEVGIIPDSGTAISPPRASSLPPLDESVQPSYLTSHGGGSSSNGAGSSIMPGPGSANPPASPALRSPPLLLHLPARFAQCFILVLSTEQGHRRGGNVLRAHVIFGAASPRRACQHAHRGRRACGEEEADAEDTRRQGGRQGAGGRAPPPPPCYPPPPSQPSS